MVRLARGSKGGERRFTRREDDDTLGTTLKEDPSHALITLSTSRSFLLPAPGPPAGLVAR